MILRILLLSLFLISSCSTRKEIVYLNNLDSKSNDESLINFNPYFIQPFDILKIDVHSTNNKAAIPYNKLGQVSNLSMNVNLQALQLEGYLVDKNYNIKFPEIGSINLHNKTIKDVENEITKKLIEDGHLLDPLVTIRLLNAVFTVLGEVTRPGTYSFVGERLSLLQGLGYAGDLSIDGKRSEILLIRETNGIRNIYHIDLTKSDVLNENTFYIKSNDVIVVKPNFRKIKSAGFIGSAASISSVASLLLSITLLIINN